MESSLSHSVSSRPQRSRRSTPPSRAVRSLRGSPCWRCCWSSPCGAPPRNPRAPLPAGRVPPRGTCSLPLPPRRLRCAYEQFVVIYLENQSFDYLLGYYLGANGIPKALLEYRPQVDVDGRATSSLPSFSYRDPSTCLFPVELPNLPFRAARTSPSTGRRRSTLRAPTTTSLPDQRRPRQPLRDADWGGVPAGQHGQRMEGLGAPSPPLIERVLAAPAGTPFCLGGGRARGNAVADAVYASAYLEARFASSTLFSSAISSLTLIHTMHFVHVHAVEGHGAHAWTMVLNSRAMKTMSSAV